MKHLKSILLLTAACLTGCSSNDDSEPKLNGQTPRPMYVEVSGVSRTAAQTTTETLNSFAVHYEGNRYNYIKEGGTWSTGSWPTDVANDQKIDFYADTYTYYDTHSTSYNYNNGNPYIHFTVDGTVSNQHDLLVSERKQVSYAETHGNVSFHFTHACAIPHFTVQLTDAISTQCGGSLAVKSIVLKNVNNAGNYYYATKSWQEVTGNASYTLINSPITVTTAKQSLSSGYLFMIPQTRAADGTNGTHLEITYNKGGEDKQAIIPFDIDWQAGTIHPFNILLGTAVIE